MNSRLLPGLLRATELTRNGVLKDATQLIQRTLSGALPQAATAKAAAKPFLEALPDHLPELASAARIITANLGLQTPPGLAAEPAIPAGAQFLQCQVHSDAGSRPYRLYIPANHPPGPMPLIVMLHGCTQTPEDFAAGTRMNEAAERHGILVAYPAQISSANMQRCWNWFSTADQKRGTGEPAIIAALIQDVASTHQVDRTRIYAAGLSAGGAAAAVLGQTYPDLFAAIGVHSGLACGAARDLPSAMSAMRQGAHSGDAASRAIPAIVFHGDRDSTVHPRNADAVAAQTALPTATGTRVEHGQVPGGHAYTRILQMDASGRVLAEQWQIAGAGHAWAGGRPDGSYTDPKGPDATSAMVRFFLSHRRPG